MASKKGDATKLKAQLGIQFVGIEKEIKKLEPFLAKIGKRLPDELRGGLKSIQIDVAAIGSALEKATTPDTLENLKQAMSNVALEGQRFGEAMSKAAAGSGKAFQVAKIDRTTNSLKRMNVALKQTQQQQMRTTLMSQNMLRVMQDSPFGMLGMANNIQMLGENLSHARNQGISFTKAMGAGLKNLLFGPMAFAMLITVATLVAQKWDDLVEAGHKLGDMLDGVEERQRALNSTFRQFASEKSFETWVESLNTGDLKQAKKSIEDLLAVFGDAAEDEAILKLGLGKKSGILKGLGGEAFRLTEEYKIAQQRITARERLNADLTDLEVALMKKRLVLQRLADHDILNAEQKKQKKADETEREWREKSHDNLASMRELQAERAVEAGQREIDRILDQGDGELTAILQVEMAKIALKKEIMREAERQMRIATRNVTRQISMKDLSARGIGSGLTTSAGIGADTAEQVAHERAKLTALLAQNKEMSKARAEGMARLVELMKTSTGERLEEQKILHARLLEQQKQFNTDSERATEESDERTLQIKLTGRRQQMQAMSDFSSQMGDLFGGLSDVMASEGEKGLEQNKSMLKAQAWAQAISASIGIFSNVANTPGLGPFAYAAAGAAMAATMVTLAAQIKKIDNPDGGATGAVIGGGAYTALNSNVTAQRASNFQRSEDRRNSAGIQGAAASASNTEELLSNINDGIRTQKVVIDQASIALIESQGKTINSRRVQTSN